MRLVALVGLALYVGWLVLAYEYHFLDGVNLLFHEAGHVFFGMLGRTIGVLGGTLGQLVFPTAAAVHLLRERRPFEATFCVVWLGENLLYAAAYIDDARTMVLPRVGGEIHDWNWLLGRWRLLPHHDFIATLVHFLGCLIVLTGLALAAWLWWFERTATPARGTDHRAAASEAPPQAERR